MKKLSLVVAALMFAFGTKAESEVVDGKTWFYKSDGKTCSWIVANESGYSVYDYAGDLTIPSTLGGFPVTEIGSGAFKWNPVNSVKIPSSVTKIGSEAFRYCSHLTSVTIPPSIEVIESATFANCSALKSLEIPDGVKTIASSAFAGCSAMTSVTIPSSVTAIGSHAFQGCNGLSGVSIPSGVSVIYPYVFSNCIELKSMVIPSSVTTIGDYAFCDCKKLASVLIPPSVTSISSTSFQGCGGLSSFAVPSCVSKLSTAFPDAYAKIQDVIIYDGVTSIEAPMFSGCVGLKKLTMPPSVKSIGPSAFSGLGYLETLTFPDALISIGASAFLGCKSLLSVAIPLSVTSIGASAFSGCSKLKSATLPVGVFQVSDNAFAGCEELVSVTLSERTASIGKFAFSGCRELNSVTIPASVTNIDEHAFEGCVALESVMLPDDMVNIGEYAFCDSGLKSVAIPPSIEYVPNHIFDGCSGLVSVEIPKGVKSIGAYAFYYCSSLQSVVIPAGVVSIGDFAFAACCGLTSVIIPETVKNIGVSAFNGCSEIKKVTIPSCVTKMKPVFPAFSAMESVFPSAYKKISEVIIDEGVTSIGDSAFSDCRGLMSVEIPSTVTSIGWKAFSSSGIKSLTIPSSVTSIGDAAFQSCTGLESIVIPSSVTNIGDWAFQGCSGLKSITIPSSVTSIGSHTFSGCSGLTSVEIQDGVTNIGASAFEGCSGLVSVTIPSSVTNIENDAFFGCTGLATVAISSGVKNIGEHAFGDCSGLMSVTIPSSVTNIDDYAFSACTSLVAVTIPSSVRHIGHGVFYGYYLPIVNIKDITVDIGDKERVAAMLTESGYDVSEVQWHYMMPTPIVSIADQTIIDHATAVTITSEVEGAIIHCTTDGSEPTISSPTLKKLTVTGKLTIKALAEYEGMVSEVVTVRIGLGKCESPIVSASKGMTFSGEGNVITLSCATDGVKIRYTVDGSDPTLYGGIYNGPFTISDTTRIRAIATDHRDYLDSDELNALFVRKWERLDAPECSMADGDVFYHSKQEVLLWSEHEGVDIRYTLDGSTPIEESPICNGHISVSETVTLKFAAFKDGYLPSETTTIHLTREWLAVADPVISAPESFTGKRTVATITSTTEGVHIYYTTDGSTPTTASKEYSGLIEILGTTTIRAIAMKEDWLNSGVVSATIEKVWSIGDALNLSGWPFTCSGSEPWTVCRSESYDGEASMRSGDIVRNETSELQMQVAGSGTLSFWWKASCEWTGSPDVLLYDAGEFFVDGIRRSYIQGFADWVKVEVSVDGTGPHEFVWRYSKDGSDSEGEDCVWLDCVSWTGSPKIEDAVVPSSIAGGNEDLTVNGSWVTADLVERYGKGKDIAFCEMYGSDLSAALLKPTGKKDASGNPLFVWQDYVAGTDPTDPNSLFRVSVEMVDGRPVITWDPNLNENGVCRVYTIYGKYELSDAKWHTPTNGLSRFFKVGVSMPDQGGSTGEEDSQDGEEGNSLLHRWSFNGNLLDSVGGSDAAVGGSVFQGEKEYTLRGGASGSSYIDLGDDLFPTDGSAVTMEIWATCRSASPGWTRIWQFGDMPQGYDFSSYNTSMYSENYIGMCWNGKSKFSSDDGEWDNYSWTSFTRFNEAYLSVVYAPNGDGSWTVSYRHIDVISGETISQHSFSTKGSDWSLASVGQSECLLGQALTCWDDCANASYNEVRIWNRALSEAEQKAHVAAGPDAVLAK